MDAKVIEVHDKNIVVETTVGLMRGIWKMPDSPKLKHYVLEVDCAAVITFDQISISTMEQPLVSYDKSNVYLHGLVVDIVDGILFLQFLQDIIMIQLAAGCDFSHYLDRYVCISLKDIAFYDIEVM